MASLKLGRIAILLALPFITACEQLQDLSSIYETRQGTKYIYRDSNVTVKPYSLHGQIIEAEKHVNDYSGYLQSSKERLRLAIESYNALVNSYSGPLKADQERLRVAIESNNLLGELRGLRSEMSEIKKSIETENRLYLFYIEDLSKIKKLAIQPSQIKELSYVSIQVDAAGNRKAGKYKTVYCFNPKLLAAKLKQDSGRNLSPSEYLEASRLSDQLREWQFASDEEHPTLGAEKALCARHVRFP